MNTTEVAPTTIAVPSWLAGGWRQVTRDPIASVGWVIASFAIIVVLDQLYWDTIAPCEWGYCEPRYNETLGGPTWMVDNLNHGFYEQAGRVWAIASSLAAVTALVMAARGANAWAISLAGVPLLSVPLFESYLVVTLVALTGVTWIIALRNARVAFIPGTAAIAMIWFVMAVTPGFGGGSRIGAITHLPTLGGLTAFVTVGFLVSFGLRSWIDSRADVAQAREATAKAELAERSAVATETRAAERARLARDLHDVVAHHISLVAVRAESAPYTHPDLEPVAREVLADIATDARSALTELRQVLTVLQRSESTELAPQPGALDVDSLIAEARAAGQPIEEAGEWSEVPSAVGYVLFRAAQEGLTNARRHAPGSPVRLVRREGPAVVALTLTNALPDGAAHLIEPGRGLIGMRERVEALGGTFAATVADERFVLAISLPLDVEAGDD